MANIKILGNAAVLTSTLKVEDINKLARFKPEALKIINKETKDEIFAISFGPKPSIGYKPSITSHGVSFTDKTEDGYAQTTITLPTGFKDDKDKMEYVKNQYGYILLNLNKLEDQAQEALNVTATEFANMEKAITLVE